MMNTKILQYHLVLYFMMAVGSVASCITRRCLANEFLAKELYSAPQPPECAVKVNLTSIQYETMSVDTKALRFSSRLKINMRWTDPDLAWTGTQYRFRELMLPSNKIWTPNLTVNNAVYTVVKPVSKDILVQNDGTVNFAIVMYITVVCKINLFTYPFVYDTCPVAINGWNQSSCGLTLTYGQISSVGGDRGEWKTEKVELHNGRRNYIQVSLSINPFKALVSLVIPSLLIMLVDLVSFALPLDGGERNAFKIKLVFSFTVFLLLLCKTLPDGGQCSPLIYYHYCFCQIILVVTLLISMMLTRLAKNGTIWPKRTQVLCCSSEAQKDCPSQIKDLNLNDGPTNYVEPPTTEASVQNILSVVENMDQDTRERKRRWDYAIYWDNMCFWAYLGLDIIYILCKILFILACCAVLDLVMGIFAVGLKWSTGSENFIKPSSP